MKKLLTILALLLFVIAIHATETTLWESTYTDGIELNSETVATFKAGDKLRIYATVPSGGANFKICYKGATNNWSETTIPSIDTQWPWINGDQTYYEFAFTDADITALAGMNIYIYKGENSTITKVSLITAVTQYTLTVTEPSNGSIAVSTNGGSTTTTDSKFDSGTTLTLTATANEDYSFTKWTIGGIDYMDNPYSFNLTADATVAATFTANAIPAFSLNGFVADDNNTYNTTTHTLTTASGWSGMQLWIGNNSTYSGNKLVLRTSESSQLKITVGYTDDTTSELQENAAAAVRALTLESSKKIQKVIIQNQTAGTVTFTEMAIDPLYTLTITAPENGSFTVNDGTSNLSTGASVAYGTTLTLTATPATDYSFTKWTVAGTDYTDNPKTVTLTGATTIAATFTAVPVITPVFTDGVADLSKFEVQDADKVTYDTESHKITVTEGWTGVQISTTTADDVQGKELRITFSEAAKVKASVKYADETATDTIMSDAATILYMVINGTKKISQIQIQPTDAGSVTLNEVKVNSESTKPADPVITPVFTDGVADLSKFEVQDAEKVTYDTESHKITVTEGWTGVQITATSADDVQGKELRITFSEAAKVKTTVKYADETATDTIMSDAATILYMVIDGTKKLSQIQIQPTETGSVTLSEVKVNAESTKPADPVITPVFTDGEADLSKFEVQDAEKVTYDTESHKITVTEGWTGVQITATSADDVQGKELRITFSEAAKVKTTVKYADETATDTIMSDAATILYMVIDGTKKLSQIQIQPTETGSVTLSEVKVNAESTKPADPVITPVFTDGIADLSKFEVQDAGKVSYDTESHKITVSEGWTGVQLTATSADDVQGNELRITFSEASKVKASVKYADETATDSIMAESATILYMVIDGTKKVSQIQIQPTEAGSVTLSEVVVNAESTKPADPVITPVFTDGAADLSKFEVQDADKVSYDTESHKITVTEGWTGVQITATSADDVQGEELRITFSEAAKVKATVKYADETAADTIMSDAATILYMVIDGTKKVSQIQIQPTETGSVTLSEVKVNAESTKPADPVITPVFTDGEADLSKFEVQDAEKVSYDAESHKITVTEGWTGVQITATSADDVQGKELRITFSEAAKVKATVKYADETSTDSIMGESATILYMVIDGTKKVSQIQIQPTETGSVTLSEVKVNAESTKPADPEIPDEPSQTGVNITLDNLNEGWNSTYDATTKTIDITSDWGARGWYIGDDRYNSKGSITVKFEAVDFGVTLKMEYTNTDGESKDTSASAAAGETEVTLDIPANVKTIDKVYLTYEKAATLKLTAAIVNDPVVDNRTEKTLVEKTQAISDGDIEINRGLFSNAVAGDILRIYATGLSSDSKIALESADYSGAFDGVNWTAFTESPFALKLTKSLLSKVQEKNLLIRGENYTFTKAVLYTEQELGEAIGGGGDEPEISNTDASEETKKLFNVLKDLYGKKIISGVVANVDWNTKEAENVYNWTGKWPALNVYDFINLHASKDVNSEGWLDYSDITTAKNWWKEGGIVGAMWHWQVKANNGTDYTCTPGTAANETSFDASKVYVDGTDENTLAKQQLDQLCGYLKKMQDAGIPVVWRPLHEGSGNVEQYAGGTAWFWWGAKGADVYKQLWQWMYNYMVKTKGLNNLIWVWTSQTKDNNWYPGDAYVDIIGRDNYGATAATLATEYDALKDTYSNKMITLSECGDSETAEMAKLSSIWDAGSRWSWFMTWYDGAYNDGTSTTHKHADKTWWDDAMAKDYVVTRDQMKELLGQDSGGGSQTGVNISLDDLNEGWSSTYDATTKTITTTGEWAARGWYIGDDRYSQKGSITVKYEAVQFGVTLKMEYTNTNGDSKSVSAGAAAGETEVELDIPADVKTIEKVYITYQPIGTLKLTAVSVNEKVADNRTEKTLVEVTQAISDGDIKLNRGLFSNAVAKDVIYIYATGLSDASKIALEPADYSGALDGAQWTAFTESPFTLKLTASALATIKEKGLLVRGENYTFVKATLYTENELGSIIPDEEEPSEDPQEPTKEEPVISEDGEVNLGEVKAQDETTTVTYDEESGELTITTTEPYKAAQIWFNEPAEVSSEVLKVEIAESNANVIVTVGYTDGTNTSAASGVAASRAFSRGATDEEGTVIKVPLSSGKEIQKIEFKNVEPGTITITSITITTLISEGEKTTLWSSNEGETLQWNDIARQTTDLTNLLKEYDELLITVSARTEGNEWPKVFLRDINYESVGRETLLNEVTTFPYIVRYVLTSELLEKIKDGFSVCGDGVTVTKVELYRPVPPKEGDIHLRALDYGYGSSYDVSTCTVTTTTRWAARGWEIGDMRYNSKDLVIIGYEAVDFPVTIKMEYVDSKGQKQATSTGMPAGKNYVQMAIPEGITQLDRVYLTFQNAGSLKLTEASVVTMGEANSRGLINDGVSTDIREVKCGEVENDKWYDMNGRQVEHPSKGLYIKNGKKVMHK